ncbi:MAG: acetate kinase, partial [Clostridia bacterium]|nr:acetate kinase [Clostridia bacterium]
MLILVINAGSSSLKYQLFDMDSKNVLAKGLCERIGISGGRNIHKVGGKEIETVIDMKTHADAIRILTDKLTDKEYGVVSSMKDIDAVGHRVLHGGQKFSGSVLVTPSVEAAIEECIPLGPLHNPANLLGIRACREVMGEDVPQVAVFDTAFHQTMPPYAFMYAIPYEYYRKYSIRRYGFHGTSHRYVSARAAELLGKKPEDIRVITCHLGNGSSLAAVEGGKCVDTSMGLTPLDGVPMGTRSGAIDPAILGFLGDNEGMSASELVTMLNKKSGVLGISEISSDFRDLTAAASEGNEQAALALKMFTYSVKKYIGSYAAAMGGTDVIVFTGGIGENNV